MKKPIYIRDGRKFKRVEDHVGDFWTKEGLWQKERDKDCVGQCIKQDAEKYTIAMFILVQANWYEAFDIIKELVHKNARIPSIGELMELSPKLIDNVYHTDQIIWSSTEYYAYHAWGLCYSDNGINVGGVVKNFNQFVLSFVDVYYE